jgi:hypothetical protein
MFEYHFIYPGLSGGTPLEILIFHEAKIGLIRFGFSAKAHNSFQQSETEGKGKMHPFVPPAIMEFRT